MARATGERAKLVSAPLEIGGNQEDLETGWNIQVKNTSRFKNTKTSYVRIGLANGCQHACDLKRREPAGN